MSFGEAVFVARDRGIDAFNTPGMGGFFSTADAAIFQTNIGTTLVISLSLISRSCSLDVGFVRVSVRLLGIYHVECGANVLSLLAKRQEETKRAHYAEGGRPQDGQIALLFEQSSNAS